MLLQIQTSSSDMIPISDFQYIYDLAKCSKCQMFTLLKNTNKLYGSLDYDSSCIHEIDVPFIVNTDLIFRLDNIDKDMIYSYKSFFIPEKFNWVILPDYYWDMYMGNDLISEYRYDLDQYVIIDKTTKQPIQQIQMYKCRLCNDFERLSFMDQLFGLFRRCTTLSNPVTFYNAHQDDNIRKVFDSKSSIGRVLCRMRNDSVDVAFYLYKSLFSLSKSDSLDIDIRFDRYENNIFMATFKPKKKKNPLKYNTYGVSFQERIHCMFVNII